MNLVQDNCLYQSKMGPSLECQPLEKRIAARSLCCINTASDQLDAPCGSTDIVEAVPLSVRELVSGLSTQLEIQQQFRIALTNPITSYLQFRGEPAPERIGMERLVETEISPSGNRALVFVYLVPRLCKVRTHLLGALSTGGT